MLVVWLDLCTYFVGFTIFVDQIEQLLVAFFIFKLFALVFVDQ